nr:hypothetical protein [Escherichia coli]
MPEENKGFLSVEEVAGNTGEIHKPETQITTALYNLSLCCA